MKLTPGCETYCAKESRSHFPLRIITTTNKTKRFIFDIQGNFLEHNSVGPFASASRDLLNIQVSRGRLTIRNPKPPVMCFRSKQGIASRHDSSTASRGEVDVSRKRQLHAVATIFCLIRIDQNACMDLSNAKCQLVKGQMVNYNLYMPIAKSMLRFSDLPEPGTRL